jgi:hypothetical protein
MIDLKIEPRRLRNGDGDVYRRKGRKQKTPSYTTTNG